MKLKVEEKLDKLFTSMSLMCKQMREATKENGQDLGIAITKNNG